MSIPMRKGINKWRLGTSLPNELGEKTYETRSVVKLATSTWSGLRRSKFTSRLGLCNSEKSGYSQTLFMEMFLNGSPLGFFV